MPSSRPVTGSPISSSNRARATTASDAELTAGVGPLWQKIALWRPAAIVFVYKRAATICGRARAARALGSARRRGDGAAGRAS